MLKINMATCRMIKKRLIFVICYMFCVSLSIKSCDVSPSCLQLENELQDEKKRNVEQEAKLNEVHFSNIFFHLYLIFLHLILKLLLKHIYNLNKMLLFLCLKHEYFFLLVFLHVTFHLQLEKKNTEILNQLQQEKETLEELKKQLESKNQEVCVSVTNILNLLTQLSVSLYCKELWRKLYKLE